MQIVEFGDGKILLEAVGILSLSNYSWTLGLQIVSLVMYGMHCLFSLVMENSCSRQFFEVIQLFLDSWIAECFVRHVWYALSVFSRDGKFLLEAVGILSILGHLDCRLFR